LWQWAGAGNIELAVEKSIGPLKTTAAHSTRTATSFERIEVTVYYDAQEFRQLQLPEL
jgi:hypothetical protein